MRQHSQHIDHQRSSTKDDLQQVPMPSQVRIRAQHLRQSHAFPKTDHSPVFQPMQGGHSLGMNSNFSQNLIASGKPLNGGLLGQGSGTTQTLMVSGSAASGFSGNTGIQGNNSNTSNIPKLNGQSGNGTAVHQGTTNSGTSNENQAQIYFDFMNLQHQLKTNGDGIVSGGGHGGQANTIQSNSVITSRRDIKLPVGVAIRHSSLPRGNPKKLKQGQTSAHFQIGSPPPSSQRQGLIPNIKPQGIVPNQISHMSIQGINQAAISAQIQLQQQFNDEFVCTNPFNNQAVPLTQGVSSNSQLQRAGAFTSLGTTTLQGIVSLGSGQSNQGSNNSANFQPQGLFSPGASIGQTIDSQQQVLSGGIASTVPHSLGTTASGFPDPSERSTTSGTTLPQLQITKNSFHKRQRGTTTLNTTIVHPLQNPLQGPNGGDNTQHNSLSSHHSVNLSQNIIQFTGPIPTLAQVQTIGSITKQNLKLRTIPKRTHKIINATQVMNLHSNSSATDDETQTQSRQQKGIMQISGEKLSISGQSSNTQGGGGGGVQRSSPLEFLKSEQKVISNISQTPSLSAYHSSNPGLTEKVSQNQSRIGHQISSRQTLQSNQHSIANQSDDRNSSPILMPISLKQRLQNLVNQAQNNGADVSPIPIGNKHQNFQNASNSVHASQFYSVGNVPQVMASVSSNFGEFSEIVTGQSALNNSTTRDIKIRKLNPSLGKSQIRFQTSQQNLNQQPTQASTMINPSPLTITSINSQNLFSNPQSQHQNTIGHASKRTVESGISIEFSGIKNSKQGYEVADESVAPSYLNNESPISMTSKAFKTPHVTNAFNQHQDAVLSAAQAYSNLQIKNNQDLQKIRVFTRRQSEMRKFTTHSKFITNRGNGSFSAQKSVEIRQLSNQKQSLNFSSIPHIVQANIQSQNVSLNNTFVANPKNPNAKSLSNQTKDSPNENGPNHCDDLSQNTSTVMHLESYDMLSSPDIIGIKATGIVQTNVKEPSSFLDGENPISTPELKMNQMPPFMRGFSQKAEDLEISGFEHEELPLIDKVQEQVHQQNFNQLLEEEQINNQNEYIKHEEYKMMNQSPRAANLAVIEEEYHDETNKSQQSRKRGNSILQSHSTLSSGTKNQIPVTQQEIISRQQSVKTNANLNQSQDNGSPVLSKFLTWRKNSDAFNKIYRQIWESGVNPAQGQTTEEFEQQVEMLSKISASGNQLTKDEIKRCIITMRKNQQLRDKFQNPYLKRIRQRSFGAVSRSNDYLNFSQGTYTGGFGTSQSVIEENIIVTQNHSNSMASLTNSLNHAINNGAQIGGAIPGSLYAQALAYNQAKNAKLNKMNSKLQARTDYVCGEQDLQASSSGEQQKALKFSPTIGGSGGANSGSSANNLAIPGMISKKQMLYDSQSLSASKVPLTVNDMKRLQYSQKHQSNKAQIIQNLQNGIILNAGANGVGSNTNDSGSNSLVNNALNTSFNNNKVRSYQNQNSHDGISSQKSDPNQNRLNKLSSGSDSYYIPQSGESFHYQPPNQKTTFGQRQTKSLVRQTNKETSTGQIGGAGIANQNDANFTSSGSSGGKVFNDVLNGQKAVFTNRVVAPVSEKIQGTLKKWKEIRLLGQGTSGEVFLVQDVMKNAQPQFFVVKKLTIVSPNSGIDKEAIAKLRKEIEVYKKLSHDNIVKFYGSEVVGTQFCIYLEYLAGGTIQANYQSHPKQRLGEKQIKNFTKQILVGLQYLHENKVVHGDLKGANVLVDDTRKNVKLTDFGSAKLVESSISQSDMNCIIRGSLAWMAPEVLNNKGIRRKADIWSLGCLVIEMAVGGNPWGNELASLDNNYQALMRIVDPTKSPPIPQGLSADCQDFISRCLTREYDKRPTAQDLLVHPWIVSLEEQKGVMSLEQIQEHIV